MKNLFWALLFVMNVVPAFADVQTYVTDEQTFYSTSENTYFSDKALVKCSVAAKGAKGQTVRMFHAFEPADAKDCKNGMAMCNRFMRLHKNVKKCQLNNQG